MLFQLQESSSWGKTDAELIAICVELCALDRASDELGDRPLDEPGVDEAIARNEARYEALLAEAAAIPAVTLEGVRARLATSCLMTQGGPRDIYRVAAERRVLLDRYRDRIADSIALLADQADRLMMDGRAFSDGLYAATVAVHSKMQAAWIKASRVHRKAEKEADKAFVAVRELGKAENAWREEQNRRDSSVS